MPTAPDSHHQIMGASESDGLDDVGGPCAPRDQRGLAIERAIPDPACLIVAGFSGLQQITAQTGPQIRHRRAFERNLPAVIANGGYVCGGTRCIDVGQACGHGHSESR